MYVHGKQNSISPQSIRPLLLYLPDDEDGDVHVAWYMKFYLIKTQKQVKS